MRRSLLLEDQADSRAWLATVLRGTFPGVEVREARTLAEARAALAQFDPELALVDLNLPDGSGVDLIAELSLSHRACISVVATIYADDRHLFPALRAGARGYLLKEQSQQELSALLQRIAAGEPPLSPAIAWRLLDMFAPGESAEDQLAPREREVLTLIARGYKLEAVARALDITHSTAATYVKQIYRKLRVSNRAEAALEAARRGLVDPHV
jgi:DNA-binding NarL/FixJ family response regulator